jgi:ubiquinone/menaquinone biosynthesis C-methylase UbiE
MDAPDVDPVLLARSLAFIRRVNAVLGYTRTTIGHLERFSRGWRPGETIRIIDLATGSADIPRAILRWADRKGWDVRIVGVDLHAATALAARQGNADPRLQIVRADALDLPFADGSFDYALTAMFLHHLDDDVAVRVLAAMGRVARRGIVAADLLRHRRAYAWISLFTLCANPMVRHDARVSVAQAFTKSEVLRMRDAAGIGFSTYHRHFGHRWVLAGER